MSAVCEAPEFHFAHLSDLHLSDPGGCSLAQLCNKRLLGYLSWRKSRRAQHQTAILDRLLHTLENLPLDQLLITGDLTHLGLPAEFRQARDWLDASAYATRITLVPGNHDAYARAAWQQTFALWQPYMAADRASEEGAFPSLRIRGPVAFIGLSSALPTAPLLATGSLSDAQLKQLPGVLNETARQGLFRVVLLHHEPLPGTSSWRKRLTNAARLSQILRTHGAELILHGHTHRNSETQWAVQDRHPPLKIPVIGTSSASAVGRDRAYRAGFRHFCLHNKPDGWHLNMRTFLHAEADKTFIQHTEQCFRLPYPAAFAPAKNR